jgi:hypothetical protein
MSSACASVPCGPTDVRANCQLPGSPPPGRYEGSDSVGKVRFVLMAGPETLKIRGFLFAGRTVHVGSRHRSRLNASGITISGSVYRAFIGDFFRQSPLGPGISGYAHGVVRVHTATCDSEALPFTATWAGS